MKNHISLEFLGFNDDDNGWSAATYQFSPKVSKGNYKFNVIVLLTIMFLCIEMKNI